MKTCTVAGVNVHHIINDWVILYLIETNHAEILPQHLNKLISTTVVCM
jgi:hypothetical protein